MRRRRKRRLNGLLLLPPVLLAALFIWIFADWIAVRRSAESGLAFLEAAGAEKEGNAAAGILSLQVDTGEGSPIGAPLAGNLAETSGDKAGERPVTLLFGGDIYLSSHVLSAYERAGGIEGVLDPELRAAVGESDLFMVNEEFPFSDRGTPAQDKEYTFRLPAEKVSVMQEIGPDIVSLANNHAMDYGADALLDTCEILDGAGIRHVGAGADLEEAKRLEVMEAGGLRIGFLAASRVIPVSSWAAGKNHPGMLTTYDPNILLAEIAAAESECDYLVVYVHWGVERETEPDEAAQRKLGKQYIDAGADLVVGSHPHVLQGIEYYKGKPIVYSLGNFVFGSSIPRTALLKVELPGGTGYSSGRTEPGEDEEVSLSLIPCMSSAGYTRRLEPEKWPEFFQYMEELSFDVSFSGDGTVLPAGDGGSA